MASQTEMSYREMISKPVKAVPERVCPACGRGFVPVGTKNGTSRKYCYDPGCERRREASRQHKQRDSEKRRGLVRYKKKRVLKAPESRLVAVGQHWQNLLENGAIRILEIVAMTKKEAIVKILSHRVSPARAGKNQRIPLADFRDSAAFTLLTKQPIDLEYTLTQRCPKCRQIVAAGLRCACQKGGRRDEQGQPTKTPPSLGGSAGEAPGNSCEGL